MHIPFVALFLASLTFASPLEHAIRANDLSATVVKNIATLSADLTKLNTTLNTFKPFQLTNLVTALKIQSQNNGINTDITTATKNTNASAPWSYDSSLNVAEAIFNLQPIIFSVLDNVVRHKQSFATAIADFGDLSKTVQADLIKQQTLSRIFGNSVTAKLDPSLAVFAPASIQAINDQFAAAIKAYKKCTGTVCLPPVST